MSAVAGVWRLDGGPGAADLCVRMLRAQAMFGPDAQGHWDGGAIALGRRLARLLPQDAYDAQPMTAGSATSPHGVLVADVRLDNRETLEAALQIDPRQARTLCDAALLLAAWERWADDCFDQLVGDYAFAHWDVQARRLTLARDPLGHRPLHYQRRADRVVFASTALGLHALPDARVEVDQDCLARFLDLSPERGPGSFYRDICRVEPGEAVAITGGGLATWRHWRAQRRTLRLRRSEDYVEALRAQLDQAVRARLRGAGPEVGAHLSSGWDSAAVAATAARLLAPEDRRLTAFTAVPRPGYDGVAPTGRHGDEGDLAAATVALHGNMSHVRVEGAARSPLDDLDGDALLAGRPVFNPCNQVWFNDINRAARTRGLRVMLTGDYGNLTLTETGVGQLADLVRRGDWPAWLGHARRLSRSGAMRWRAILATSFEHDIPRPVWRLLVRLNGGWDSSPAFHTALNASRRPPAAAANRAEDSFQQRLDAFGWRDPAPYVKGALARWGIDVRDPLSDRRLVEFCLAVPVEQHLAGGLPRALARRALADRVPQALLAATSKGYQAVDWHEGLTADRAALLAELDSLQACPPVADMIDIPRLRRLADDWPDGAWHSDAVIDQYRSALMRGVAAGRFLRRSLGANS